MRIGIYGGTFNPPHVGHVHAAAAAGRALELDQLLIVPDNIPPHKTLPEGSPDNKQRLEMVRLAFGSIPCAEVTDIELRRAGMSFTVDTLRALREEHPGAELWLLMGSDMLECLHLWHEPEMIVRLAHIAAFVRGAAGEREMFDRMLPLLRSNFGADVTLVPMEALAASSTEVRLRVREGTAADLLPEPVWGYIQREGLYGVQADLTHLAPRQLRPVALSYLKPSRVAHVLGTEDTAARLARRYGADEEKARVAALLHDCTKKLSLKQQLALCGKYGAPPDELERRMPQLLHAKTGAHLAREVFAVDDEIYGAIRWHTTGRADMTCLEKVIYLADCIEQTRRYPGVEELRRQVDEDLDKGLVLALEMTVQRMESLGEPIHEKTLEALRFLKG